MLDLARTLPLALAAVALALASCSSTPYPEDRRPPSRAPVEAAEAAEPAEPAEPAAPVEPAAPAPAPADVQAARDAFFEGLTALCGRQLEGRAVYLAEPSEVFENARLVMEVSSCSPQEIRIPFIVGTDRSRTWVITRSEEGLLFVHDHRHPDGTPEKITDYGGWATMDGSRHRQRFPAHQPTARMIPEAATNVWTLELRPSEGTFVYDLERHGAPRFRAVFALPRAHAPSP